MRKNFEALPERLKIHFSDGTTKTLVEKTTLYEEAQRLIDQNLGNHDIGLVQLGKYFGKQVVGWTKVSEMVQRDLK